MGCCVVSCTTSHWWWHCVLAHLLIVCLGAHSWQCPLARSLLACVRVRSLMASCPLARSLAASCARALALALACMWHRVRAQQWQHSVGCALVAPHVTCKRSIVEQWNHRVFVMISYDKIMLAYKDKTEFWCFPRSFLVYLKPWYCFYIRLKYQRLRGKKARQTSKP